MGHQSEIDFVQMGVDLGKGRRQMSEEETDRSAVYES